MVAAKAGVRAGMTVAHARALLGGIDVRVEPFDEEGDARALRALAQWAIRFSPIVATDEPDGLLIDATGCERLYRGQRRLLNAVTNSIERLGFRCRVAMAPTCTAAWALARFGHIGSEKAGDGRIVVEDVDLESVLAPLPVRALRLSAETVEALGEVGVERIGQVLELPRDLLPSRFGEELLLAMDRATGRAIEVIEPVRPAAPLRAERVFAGPVTRVEGIEACTHELLSLLCAQLARQEGGVRRLVVVLDRSDMEQLELSLELSRPSRDVGHLWSLLRPKLERAHLGFGVDGVSLIAARAGRLAHRQGVCWGEAGGEPIESGRGARLLGEMIDTLVARVGRERVTRIEGVESHEPERAFHHVGVMEGRARRHEGTEARSGGKEQQRSEETEIMRGDRPSVLFGRAEEARVVSVTPDGPPYRVWWRGEEHEIVAAVGPERIGGEWWGGEKARRHAGTKARRGEEEESVISCRAHDYFRVETGGGRWLWVRRAVGGGGGVGGTGWGASSWSVCGEWA